MRNIVKIILLLSVIGCNGQVKVKNVENKSVEQEVKMIFVGDVMGHGPQIRSAYDEVRKEYNYDGVFEKVSSLLRSGDFTIGNLEVTLGGEPYTGYPTFSSPDGLAVSCKRAGIDAFVTANNHSCDRRKVGILRTIKALDSIAIPHTGTFSSVEEREKKNLLVFEKNGIKVGILNYTFGTNGIPVPEGVVVNLLDKELIAKDIEEAKGKKLDKLIAFVHWGVEYVLAPNKEQKDMADFLFEKGVDVIIGSHPHVVQPIEFYKGDSISKERLVVYSLGNFISNQRKVNTDGGMVFEMNLKKKDGKTSIDKCGYHLVWVERTREGNKAKYRLLPCVETEKGGFAGMAEGDVRAMKLYMNNMRAMLGKNNINVDEIK